MASVDGKPAPKYVVEDNRNGQEQSGQKHKMGEPLALAKHLRPKHVTPNLVQVKIMFTIIILICNY